MTKFLLSFLVAILFTSSSVAQFKENYRPKAFSRPTPIVQPAKQIVQDQTNYKIIAIINGEIVSNSDLQNRVNAFVFNTKIPLNNQTRQMINQAVMTATVDEKIKLQEASKNHINISEQEINNAINMYEKNNKIAQGKLQSILKENGIEFSAFKTQMESDLAWVKLVRQKILSQGQVTQKEIEETQVEAKKDLTTEKYMISEIFIEEDKAKDIGGLVTNLKRDPRFNLYAAKFSHSASSANGGKLGWINKGKLAEPLEKALNNMQIGDVSEPILYNNGYYILKLEQRFDPKTNKAKIPNQKEIKAMLENQKLELFAKQHLQDLRQKAVTEVRN